MAANNSNTLVDQKLAVSLFLDSLLREPETELVTETPAPEVVAEVQPEIKVEEKPAEPVVEIPAQVKVKEVVEVTTEPETDTGIESKLASEAEASLPVWANSPFQVLLFTVGGLKLAVPLIELSGVIEWTDSVTEMPGHADFYMGILQHLDNKVAVIDTARMVLPDKKMAQIADIDPRKRVKHIVLIDDYKWGLACDEISEVITLNPDEVRWRTSKTSRDWLAGTVIDHMCALMNSQGFSNMLAKGSI
jgi:purine-binding chemotaxis protein CheW